MLNQYTATHPLVIVGRLKTFSFWPAPFDGINMKSNNLSRTLSRNQVPAFGMAAMMVAELLKENISLTPEQKQELYSQLQLFVKMYQIKVPGTA